VADARAALEALPPGASPARAHATAGLAEALIEMGELDTAAGTVDELRGHDPLSAARVLLALGRPLDALTELDIAAAELEAAGVTSPAVAPWRSLAADCHLALGDPARAQELANDELELARTAAVPSAQARALRALGCAADGREALASLREAERLASGSPARLEHVRALLALGIALRADGQTRAARSTLKSGMEHAHRCGAVALAERCRDELIRAGARPRRAVHSGPAGLTRSERRVAELAALGRTNREIGDGLFVTINTVAAHLASVYRKLGINSRAQRPTALAI